MVRLRPVEQAQLVSDHPQVFQLVKGAWGANGCTQVALKPARKAFLWPALVAAWKRAAPQRLVQEFDGD